ncbi:MAG TPA: hypothetical protein VF457_13070 [Burkholderiaceae bacterium]
MTRLDAAERRRLGAECQIAILQYAIDAPQRDELDLAVAMFWAGVDAALAPRGPEIVASDLYATRLRAQALRGVTMRTTDPDPQPIRPLGERVPAPAPVAPRDKPVPGAGSGIVQGPDGRLRTTDHRSTPCGSR